MAKRAQKKGNAAWRIVTAALALALEQNWRDLNLADIAAATKISETDLRVHFSSKLSILWAINEHIDKQVIGNSTK